MRIRAFVEDDLTALIELTIEAFRPYHEDVFRPMVGEVVFTNQHGGWQDDYREQIPELHAPERHAYVAVAEDGDGIAGYVAWSVDPDRKNGSVSHLAVSAAHRRNHVGTALCEHAFAQMRTVVDRRMRCLKGETLARLCAGDGWTDSCSLRERPGSLRISGHPPGAERGTAKKFRVKPCSPLGDLLRIIAFCSTENCGWRSCERAVVRRHHARRPCRKGGLRCWNRTRQGVTRGRSSAGGPC